MGMLLLTSSPVGLWPWGKLVQAERGHWEVTGLTCEGPSSSLPTRRNFWCSHITVFIAVACSHAPWTSGLETETGTGRGQNSPCSRLNPSCLMQSRVCSCGSLADPSRWHLSSNSYAKKHSGSQLHHSQVKKRPQTFPFAFKAICISKMGSWCMHTCKMMCQKQA